MAICCLLLLSDTGFAVVLYIVSSSAESFPVPLFVLYGVGTRLHSNIGLTNVL